MINIGIFSLSSCSGCLIEFLNLEDTILDLLRFLDIKEAQILTSSEFQGDFDISFIEGSPTTEEQIRELEDIRKRSGTLVALGTCACYGGVQSMVRDVGTERAVQMQYGGIAPVRSIEPRGIGEYVEVEHMLYGCPFERSELLELVKCALMGMEYRDKEHSVCTECILRENDCLLDRGEPCMGPVTRGGCDARCPANGMYCTGCRGEYRDMNVSAHVEKLREMGYSDEDIRALYNKYYRRMGDE